MNIWILQTGEPLPYIDTDIRLYRCGLLTEELLGLGANVTWWCSTFDHRKKKFRDRSVGKTPPIGLKYKFLHGSVSYSRNFSPFRLINQLNVGKHFSIVADSLPQPDLIVISLPTLELVHSAMKYARRNNVRTIIDVRDLWPDVYLNGFHRFLRPVAKWFLSFEYTKLRNSLARTDALVATSRGYLEWALCLADRLPREWDRVFPIGYSESRTDYNGLEQLAGPSDSATKRFVYLGSFGHSFDLVATIEASKELLRRRRFDISLNLFGDGEHYLVLQDHGRRYPNLKVFNWASSEQSGEALRNSTASLALYSATALQSLPNKLFNYIAAGAPIICSLPGDARSLILREGLGLTYEGGCGESLADTIEWIADHPLAGQEMGQRGLEIYKTKYTGNQIYSDFARFLYEFAEGDGPSRGCESDEAIPRGRAS